MSWAYGSHSAPRRALWPARMPVRAEQQTPLTELSQMALAARSGDGAAQEDLLDRVSSLVHRYCRARLGGAPGGPQSAEDAAQEACLNLVRLVPQYRSEDGPFEALVFTVASRRVADQQRAGCRAPIPVEELPEGPTDLPGPEDEAIRMDATAAVHRLLAHLTKTQREVVTLRVAVGMSAQETAAALNMSSGAVRVVQHRALAKLRKVVADQERRRLYR